MDLRVSLRRTSAVLAVLLLSAVASDAESLADAVRAAVTSNPAARAANFDVQISAFELLELKREFEPSVGLYGDAGARVVDAPARLTPADNGDLKGTANIGIAAEIVLFDGYRRANMVYDRAARLDGSIFRLLDASETMALNAVEAYIDVKRHAALLDVARQNVSRHREIERQVDALVDGGRLPVSDSFEIDERLLAARMAELDIKRALADAEARYQTVIGHKPKGALHVPAVSARPKTVEALIAASVRNSFQVKYASALVQQTYYDKSIAEADTRPQVKLRAGVNHGINLNGTTSDETDAFVGLQFNWDFYTGGRKARGAAYTQRTRAAMAERDKVVREVQELAMRAWNAHVSAGERLGLINRQMAASRNIVAQYRNQFEGGTRSLLDVLESERALFNVRFEKIGAEASLSFASYRLLAAQSRLSQHFGVRAADVPLDPGFQARARNAQRPAQIFNTEIKALE